MGEKMSSCKASCSVLLACFIVGLCSVCQCSAAEVDANQTANLIINGSSTRPIPETLFGIFFEVSFLLSIQEFDSRLVSLWFLNLDYNA
jgi:alpha-N-arabinofuranosidase